MDTVQPKKLKTKNIRQSVLNFSLENKISIEECSFKINKVVTYIKTSADDTFKLFNEDINIHYENKAKLLNEHVEFKQIYIITLYKPAKNRLKLHYSIDFEQFCSHPKMIIHHDSLIPYKRLKPKELFVLLRSEINRIKAYHGILLNIFDDQMIKNLKAFVKHIYSGKFSKRIKLPLFEGVAPEITRESKLIMWFEQKKSNHQIIEVEKGELLVEYIKPIFGKSGFNAFGKLISAEVGKNAQGFDAEVDESTIEIVENEDKTLYKSKIKGFVHFVNNKLKVDNRVSISKLSRIHDDLAKDEENNVEVIISQHDTAEDSVGEGVKLTSETIHVTGFIGSKSVLRAVNLKIDGATHQDSIQFAKFATINRHKGTLRCHDAKINLLEGGEIHATSVEIESSIGGIVYAQDVTLGTVKNNLKVYASNSISVKVVMGEDNLFKINYKDIPLLTNKIEFIDKDIEELKLSLKPAARRDPAEISKIKEKIQELKNTQNKIIHSSEYAKISVEQPFRGLNIITFTLSNGDELTYKTEAKQYEPFYLELTEEKVILHPVNKTISLEG